MTYGQIRKLIVQAASGIHLDLIDAWIMHRYQEILDSLSWKRLDATRGMVTAAEYSTGTMDVTQGSDAITGSGTTWTAAMNGRSLRVNGEADYYSFTYVSATTGTLGREYTGSTAAAASYRINQSILALDTDVRLVQGVRTARRELHRIGIGELRRGAPDRNRYGDPLYWALAADSFTDPPTLQIELLPAPTEATSLYVDQTIDSDGLVQGSANSSLLPWVRHGCLHEGVMTDASVHLEKFTAAEYHQGRFDKLLGDIRRVAAELEGSHQMQIAGRYVRHQGGGYRHRFR